MEYGRRQSKVEWEGVEVYLTDLCNERNKDYEVVSGNLSKGWSVWNSITNNSPSCYNSFEVPDGCVCYWYPNKEYLKEECGRSVDTLTRLLDMGFTYTQILEYDSQDRNRQTVLGVTGTIPELCKHFGKTESSVTTRMKKKGLTLEQALIEKPLKIKKVIIDGVADSPKNWYLKFDLDYSKVKSFRDRTKLSFEETLIHYGVDITDMKISYGDL